MASTFSGRVAFASIQFNAGVPSYRVQSGDFGAITDNGAGDITLALASQIDPADACIAFAARGGVAIPFVQSWTDSALQIRIDNGAGVLADVNCDLTIVVRPGN